MSVVGLIVNLLISITMAYSFSRFQFPGKEPIFQLAVAHNDDSGTAGYDLPVHCFKRIETD